MLTQYIQESTFRILVQMFFLTAKLCLSPRFVLKIDKITAVIVFFLFSLKNTFTS
uniref:Uncharacterized protein n=1 Tax=Anguilla anguilla TaxID=7936 RepID=A0A0E9W8N0_ANGAN